jgi:YVTN family beta-propeller protein
MVPIRAQCWYAPINVITISYIALICIFFASNASAQKPALVVVEKISGSVSFYTAGGKRVGDIQLGGHPHEIILSPDSRSLYVTDNGILWMTDPGEGGNTISIIDVESRKKVGVIDLKNFRRPHGIDIDPKSGRMVVTIENPDGLLLVDPAQRKILRKYNVEGSDPHMVLFGPKGEWAYVSNTGSATVAAVHLATGKVKLIPTDARPQGGVLSHDGRLLYVTNSDGNSISVIDTEKKARVGVIRTGKGPGRIALTSDGKTLVYNLQLGEAVGFADVATRKQTAVVPLGGRPLSLTMSRDGSNAYAGVQDQDKIFVISVPERKVIRTFETPKGAGPDPVLPLPQ